MNLHHRDVDELPESVSGHFFQRHVRQPSAGRHKSGKKSLSKDKDKLRVVRSGVTHSLGTALAAALEASWVSLLHRKVRWLHRQMAGQLKAQQERTFRTADSESRSQTPRGAMDDTPHTSHTRTRQPKHRSSRKVKGMKHWVTGPKPKERSGRFVLPHVGLLTRALLPSGAVVTTRTLLSEDGGKVESRIFFDSPRRRDVTS